LDRSGLAPARALPAWPRRGRYRLAPACYLRMRRSPSPLPARDAGTGSWAP